MDKVLSFKPRVGKVKMDQTTGRFTVISPFIFYNVRFAVKYFQSTKTTKVNLCKIFYT